MRALTTGSHGKEPHWERWASQPLAVPYPGDALALPAGQIQLPLSYHVLFAQPGITGCQALWVEMGGSRLQSKPTALGFALCSCLLALLAFRVPSKDPCTTEVTQRRQAKLSFWK